MFTFGIASLTGLLFGLVPALHLARGSTHDAPADMNLQTVRPRIKLGPWLL